MAKFSTFLVDSNAIEAGQWVSPGEEFDDFEILTRGYTDAYTDAKAAKFRRLAAAYGGDERRIPNNLTRDAIVDCLVKHVLLDVRGLQKEDGSKVTFDEFATVLRTGAGATYLNAVIRAASLVGTSIKEAVTEAVGN